MNNLKAERTLTAEEQRSIVDGEWWKSICEPCGLIVRGFTYRASALVTDKDTGQAVTIPGWLARRIESLSTQQPMGEVRVKELEWEGQTAIDAFGLRWSVYVDYGREDKKECFVCNCIDGTWPTAEEAKAAVQSDYRKRIISALYPNQESGE